MDKDAIARRTILAAGGNPDAPTPADAKPKALQKKPEQEEFRTRRWVVDAAEGVTPDDILRPEFWSICAQDLNPFDRMEVRADDGTWLAELLVLTTSRAFATMRMLQIYDLSTSDVDQTKAAELEALASPFMVKHRGPRKWSVVRKADKEVLAEDMDSEAKAEDWIKERVRAGV